MNAIHSRAIIGKSVRLGEGNEIGPGCVIEDGAVLGAGNCLWANVYVGPGTTIGDGNQIHMGAVIGHAPQDTAFTGEPSFTRLGSRNLIREYVTIHRGTKPGSETVVGDDNFLMANAHLGHNCRLGSRVTLVNAATLAGYCEVEDGVLISGLVVVHQFVRIGRLAMVSGLSAVNKDVPPFLFCGGRPAVIQGLNVVGLRRAGLPASVRQEIKQAYTRLYREGLNVPHALELIEQECRSAEVEQLMAFIRASTRGICAGLGREAQTLGPRKGMPAQAPPALLQAGESLEE